MYLSDLARVCSTPELSLVASTNIMSLQHIIAACFASNMSPVVDGFQLLKEMVGDAESPFANALQL